MPGHSLWIISHHAIPPRYAGGTRHYELACRLARDGYDVTIVTSDRLRPTGEMRVSEKNGFGMEMIDGVRFVWVPSRIIYYRNGVARIGNMLEYAFRVWSKGRVCFGLPVPPPDVVLGSSPHLLAPLAAWRLARRYCVPFVIEIRDLWPETIVKMGVLSRRNPVTHILYLLERFLYARSCGIISLLPNIEEYLEHIGQGSKRVAVIGNGVDAEAFACTSGPTGRKAVRIVYTGAHGPANGLQVVLEAAKAKQTDPCIEFHFYGSGSRKPDLINQARRENLQNVYFHDAVPKHQMPSILCEADILLLNYAKIDMGQYGISPNKLWEYMASGRPILFAHEAINNPVEHTGCGFSVPPENPSAMANAITALVALDPYERASLGARGRDFVWEHCDWSILAQQYASTLRRAIEESSRAGKAR